MKIAYLINQYPKVSHSFIRREIAALEAQNLEIARFSIRSCRAELVDSADITELEKTEILLSQGILPLLIALLQNAILHPLKFWKAVLLMFQVSRYSQRGTLRHIAYLAEACLLVKKLAASNITHIHAHFGTNPTTVAMLCQALRGITYSFTVHGPEEFDDIRGLALAEKIKRATFVITVSSYGRSQLYRWCDLSHWSKIHIIHCGVDESFLNHPFLPIPEQPQLVCVGRLSEQKGHLLLIDAASKLAQEGLKFKLVFVGDGELRGTIESLIEEYHLQDMIKITGWADSSRVRQEIIASRALVLPSFAEGLPVVIMEALALSRPVLSTYIAGIPELVQPNINGWLVPPGSVSALTTAMRTILEQPRAELEAMGKNGATEVIKEHDALIEAKKLAQLFQNLNHHLGKGSKS